MFDDVLHQYWKVHVVKNVFSYKKKKGSRHFNKNPKTSICWRHLRTKQENTSTYISQSKHADFNLPWKTLVKRFLAEQAKVRFHRLLCVFQQWIYCRHSLLNTLRFYIWFIVQNDDIHHFDGNYHINIAKLVISLPQSSQPLRKAHGLKARRVVKHTRKSASRDRWHSATRQTCCSNPPICSAFHWKQSRRRQGVVGLCSSLSAGKDECSRTSMSPTVLKFQSMTKLQQMISLAVIHCRLIVPSNWISWPIFRV